MLIYGHRHSDRTIHHITGVRQREREISRFSRGHAVEQNCHCPGGHLVIRDIPRCETLDEEIDLGAGKFFVITFLDDDINGADGMTPDCKEDSVIILNIPVS